MGGEWGVGASLAMEKVPPRLRGVLSGLLQEGTRRATCWRRSAYFFVFPQLGWRPLFFIGGLPALLALFVRFGVKESEVWEKTKHATGASSDAAIASHWQLFLYLFLLMTMMNFSSHGTQDMYPTFLEKRLGLRPRGEVAIVQISMVGAIIGGITVRPLLRPHRPPAGDDHRARAGDRWRSRSGRLRGTSTCSSRAAFLMQFMVQGAWGVIPAHINELSPDSVRGFLPGFAYQCGVAVAGTIAYLQALFTDVLHVRYAWAMALTAVSVFTMAAVVTWAGPERSGRGSAKREGRSGGD